MVHPTIQMIFMPAETMFNTTTIINEVFFAEEFHIITLKSKCSKFWVKWSKTGQFLIPSNCWIGQVGIICVTKS